MKDHRDPWHRKPGGRLVGWGKGVFALGVGLVATGGAVYVAASEEAWLTAFTGLVTLGIGIPAMVVGLGLWGAGARRGRAPRRRIGPR